MRREGSRITEEEIRDSVRTHMARHKAPKYVAFMDSFPMTASGKIQKYRLKDIGLDLLKEKGIDVV